MEEPTQLTLFKEEPSSITTKPLDMLKLASDSLVNGTRILSELLRLDLTPKETAMFHEWTKKSEDDFKSFKELARARLEKLLRETGTKVTEKGTLQIDLGEGRVQRATPTNTAPDSKLTEQMLSRRGLSREQYMTKDIKYKANEVLLQSLRFTNTITEEDYQSCFAPTSYRIGKTSMQGEENE